MILTDGVHLVSSSSLEELHDFAHRIGLRREWFQMGKSGEHPHYDMTARWRYRKAVFEGARVVGKKELVRRMVRA